MESLLVRLRPLSAFGGPLKGDSLFGQLCWAARARLGETRLAELLADYTAGRPFVVCSDGMPAGHLPRPALPLHYYATVADADRKAVKRRRWLPREALDRPVSSWLAHCRTDAEVLSVLSGNTAEGGALIRSHAQSHNSINRLTGTTGGGDFAPYTLTQHWFGEAVELDCYLLIDTSRLDLADAKRLLVDIGLAGYGRDASIGLGKFAVLEAHAERLPRQPNADACLTLAPCAPQGLGLDSSRSYYEVFTRFGRHGDRAVHTGRPFKAPVLLAQSGAVLIPSVLPQQSFLGQGLGGDGSLSKAIAQTVQQGYAPFVGIRLGEDAP